jgi:hypothetical protein
LVLKKGIVLDKHVLKSEYLGENQYGRPMFDTKRSDIGQSLFLLKYRNDWDQIPMLVDVLSSAITQNFSEKIDSLFLCLHLIIVIVNQYTG